MGGSLNSLLAGIPICFSTVCPQWQAPTAWQAKSSDLCCAADPHTCKRLSPPGCLKRLYRMKTETHCLLVECFWRSSLRSQTLAQRFWLDQSGGSGNGLKKVKAFKLHLTQKWTDKCIKCACLGACNCCANMLDTHEHEAAEWRRSTTPIQMREEINQVNLEAARKSFHAADANGRAILLGSIVSPSISWKSQRHWYQLPLVRKPGNFHALSMGIAKLSQMRAKDPVYLPLGWRKDWPQQNTSISRHIAGATMVGPRAAASAVGAPWLGTSP